jgi:hypothetical protein
VSDMADSSRDTILPILFEDFWIDFYFEPKSTYYSQLFYLRLDFTLFVS